MSRASIVTEGPRKAGGRRPRAWGRRPILARLSVEPLEVRSLLSVSTPGALLTAFQPNETIDLAWDLGTPSQPATTVGSVGTGPDGAADVTWYHFQLEDAARVDLTVSPPAGQPPFASVLSLFNNDPMDWGDPYDVDGHRLLAQVQADPTDGAATYHQDLGPGDYYVAVSGGGNTEFSPFLAGGGFEGTMGIYELTVGATDLGVADDGPTMLWSDPAAGGVLDSSPLAIRVGMSGLLDPGTAVPGQTVQLFAVGDGGAEVPVALAWANVSAADDELQLFPLAPLGPGQYVVQLSGDSSGGQSVLAGSDGTPLGEDAQHPAGADESVRFSVAGIDGVAGAKASDNTPATARDLGDVAGVGIVQVAGAIGVDPAFNPGLAPDPTNPDPQFLPANQVDLYHFRIDGPVRYAVLAEVFAGRIGSPLDPGISLFERDPNSGSLVFIAGDNNTFDPTLGTDGSVPLALDSALSAGLTAGDYYLAVAGGSNTPSPIEGQFPGSPGILDPNQPGSAQLGWSTGPYVLNVLVQAAPDPPLVVASSPSPGQVLDGPPTQISVKFSEPVDIQQLTYQSFVVTLQPMLPQVFVEGADGTIDYARFLTYDRTTNTATFQMLDGLPNGGYALHLSGQGGLTDLGGNALPGNDPSGDYVIPFTIQGPDRGLSGDMADGYTIAAQVGQGPQDIGVLFPDELQAGVTIARGPGAGADPGASSTEDDYVIGIPETQRYAFHLTGDDLPAGTQLAVTDASGQSIFLSPTVDPQVFNAFLEPGIYTVSVDGWSADASASVSYQLLIRMDAQQDNPPPLVDGPAPALQIALASSVGVPVSPSPGVPGASGGLATGGTVIVGPIGGGSGTIGTAGDGPGAVGPIGGGSVTVGPVAGGSDASATPVASVSDLARTEAAGGLSGLALGPLGGSGDQAAPLASPTIQVALNVPSTSALASNSLAVSLVTLTQVVASNHQGEGEDEVTEPVESSNPPGIMATDPPGPSEDGSGDAEGEWPTDPRGVSPAANPSSTMVGGLPLDLMIPFAPPAGIAPAGPLAPDVAPAPRAGIPTDTAKAAPAPAHAVDDEAYVEPGTRMARWAIAAATLAAVYRGHEVFRGLGLRKRARQGGTRPEGPVAPRASYDSTRIAHPAGGARSLHAARSRSRHGVPI